MRWGVPGCALQGQSVGLEGIRAQGSVLLAFSAIPKQRNSELREIP